MKDLLTFVKTRRMEGDFGRFARDTGEKTTYVVAIELLAWLKRQKKFRNENDLEMNPEHTWCRSVPALLATDASLSSLFELTGERLQFRSVVPADERNRIRELADAEYRPEVMT